MFSAATCPCRSATTKCSTRIISPECGSGYFAMSPAAKTPEALVSRYSFTTIPRSVVSPARSARDTEGPTPTSSPNWDRLRRRKRTRPLSSRQEQLASAKKHTVAVRSWRYGTSNGPSSGMFVEERSQSAASPEVDKDYDTSECRVRAPHGGEGISLDCVDNQENCQVCPSKDNHHPDL